MTEHATPTAHDDHEHHPPHGIGKYLAVFGCLIVLTAMSYLTFFPIWNQLVSDDPRVKWAFMMAVSCTKAMLVILFFMHVLWEANWKYVLTIPAALMSIFLILMLVPDIGLRIFHYSEERWLHAANPRPIFASHETGEHETGQHSNENTAEHHDDSSSAAPAH
jgi:cytochrome c oxidase subunit 4